jgi:hypothetical protein
MKYFSVLMNLLFSLLNSIFFLPQYLKYDASIQNCAFFRIVPNNLHLHCVCISPNLLHCDHSIPYRSSFTAIYFLIWGILYVHHALVRLPLFFMYLLVQHSEMSLWHLLPHQFSHLLKIANVHKCFTRELLWCELLF